MAGWNVSCRGRILVVLVTRAVTMTVAVEIVWLVGRDVVVGSAVVDGLTMVDVVGVEAELGGRLGVAVTVTKSVMVGAADAGVAVGVGAGG